MADDLLLPTPPESLSDDTYEVEEIPNNNQLQSTSTVGIKLDQTKQLITDAEFDYLNLHDMEKTLLKAELTDSEMYLKNIHTGFKFARSTRSLIALVGAGLAVHKRRRDIIKEIKESKKDPFEIDEHGNVKS